MGTWGYIIPLLELFYIQRVQEQRLDLSNNIDFLTYLIVDSPSCNIAPPQFSAI